MKTLVAQVCVSRALGELPILRGWRERRRAIRISRLLLRFYTEIAADYAHLGKPALYRLVVIRYLRGDVPAADEALQAAEQSFGAWPVARELQLRDVVHYLVVAERGWTAEDLRGVVHSCIPGNL